MAQAMVMPKKYFFDRNGRPLAFGKVYTYQAGTNINQETFKSEAGDIANTNPIILNGEGYADIYLNGSYRIVVKDKNDNEIWSADPVSTFGYKLDTYKVLLIANGLSGDYGFFDDGFDYVNVGDVGIDVDGKIYTYVGAGPLPVSVASGTNPNGNSDYQQVTFNDLQSIAGLNEPSGLDNVNIRDMEIANIIAEDADIGTRYNVTDLDYARYDVVSASDTGGYYYEAMASGNKLKLLHSDKRVTSAMFKTSTTTELAESIEYMSKNFLIVTWADGVYDYDETLYVELTEPTKVIWKCLNGVVKFNYVGVSPIGNGIRQNNCLAVQLHNIEFENNDLVASPLHLECSDIAAGSAGVFGFTSSNCKQVDPVTTNANGLYIAGTYKYANFQGITVGGVTYDNSARAGAGLVLANFGGIATFNMLNIKDIKTVHDKDADGLSVFGSDVGTITTSLGARAEITNSTFNNCEGRFIKMQISKWELHGCTFVIPTGATTITEWRGIDGQANNGNIHDLEFVFGSGITWGSNSSLFTLQNIRNDGTDKASFVNNIKVSNGTAGLARLVTCISQYGESTYDIDIIKVTGQPVKRGVIHAIKGGAITDIDSVKIIVKNTSVPDYSSLDLFDPSNNIDHGERLYLEFMNNDVTNNASSARLYDKDAGFSVGSNFRVANNGNIEDRVDWVFDLDNLLDGNSFYTGGQVIADAPVGNFAHYHTYSRVQRAVSTDGTSESRRTNGGSSWNAWVSV